jgi:NitT/TauT family transport system substrate-binding protein
MRRKYFASTLVAAALAPVIARAQTPRIRIGTAGQDGNASEYYAADMGFFKKYGLDDVDIQTIRRGSGAAIIAALAGGSLDIAESDLMAIAAAKLHGIDLAILWPSAISVSEHPTNALLVAKSSPIGVAKDLVGKTVAVPSLEGPNAMAMRTWLDQGRVARSDVKFVEVPMVEMAVALDRGTVDAAYPTEPNVTAALSTGKVRVLAHPWDAIGKRWVITAYVAMTEWIGGNPVAAASFAKAIRDAQSWANRNHDKSAAIFGRWSSMPAETVNTMMRSTYTERLDVALIQPLLDVGYKEKILPQPVAAKDLISAVATSVASGQRIP